MNAGVALPTTEKKQSTDKHIANDWVCPTFKVSGAFSSHMVLQQNKSIRVWGWATAIGSRISGSFMGENVSSTVAEGGRWELVFSPHPYCREGQQMLIFDENGNSACFEDVLIGDVWLIGGQSNAELTVRPCMTLTPNWDFYEDDAFRLFIQSSIYVRSNEKFCFSPQPDVINSTWRWQKPSRNVALRFSAMGYFFAREVTKLSDVPLGMIVMAASGACIREILPRELAHAEGYDYGALVCEGGYFNSLIHPFIGLSFKGMLFFQGESEAMTRELAEKYTYELSLLVADQRRRFGFEFPFYNVQLSNYPHDGVKSFPFIDMLRLSQFDALKTIPNSTLTVDMDLGSPEDYEDWAHSPLKWELGERLAKLALAREYGIGDMSEAGSPMPQSAYLTADKKQIVIEFSGVGKGLIVSGNAPRESYGMSVAGFSLGDYDHRVEASACISGRTTVTVDIPEGYVLPEVLLINYAASVAITPENATLRGGNNLPAPAFCLRLE